MKNEQTDKTLMTCPKDEQHGTRIYRWYCLQRCLDKEECPAMKGLQK
jgi:hypothetical protein